MPTDATLWIWWGFSTIIVGIVINIVSAYFKPYTDKIWEKYSNTRRIKNDKERRRIEGRIQLMLDDSDMLHMSLTMLIIYLLLFVAFIMLIFLISIMFLLISLNTSSVVSPVISQAQKEYFVTAAIILFSLLLGFFAINSMNRFSFHLTVLSRYRKRKREIRENQVQQEVVNTNSTVE
jgi:ABC-type multidrug transport system fused ATPase/permease subunit